MQLLTSIPGVGRRTASLLLSEMAGGAVRQRQECSARHSGIVRICSALVSVNIGPAQAVLYRARMRMGFLRGIGPLEIITSYSA